MHSCLQCEQCELYLLTAQAAPTASVHVQGELKAGEEIVRQQAARLKQAEAGEQALQQQAQRLRADVSERDSKIAELQLAAEMAKHEVGEPAKPDLIGPTDLRWIMKSAAQQQLAADDICNLDYATQGHSRYCS